MILKREFDIIKKLYIPPHIEFEELEVDEGEMLMAGSDNSGGGGDLEPGEGDSGKPGGSSRPQSNSIDVDFDLVGVNATSDFVMND